MISLEVTTIRTRRTRRTTRTTRKDNGHLMTTTTEDGEQGGVTARDRVEETLRKPRKDQGMKKEVM